MRQGSNTGRRPRGRTNRKQHGGGPSRPNTFDSNGPDGRVRGNARQVYEKYLTLARDAQSGGDRVAAEAYFQHAEHYYRILSDSTDPQRQDRRQEDRQPNPAPAAEAASDEPASPQPVNGDPAGASPQPEAFVETTHTPGNGHAEEAAAQQAPTGQDGSPAEEQKAAAPKRRGRPRKPRPVQQDSSAEKDSSSAEPVMSAPTPVEPTASET